MKTIFFLLGIIASPFPALTQLINFDQQGKQLVRFDVLGNAVDAHDGEIARFDGLYYLYGTSYDCGYEWGNKDAPFCGFKVYTSKDLKTWDDKGFLFDASTPVWQTRCNGKTYGCYRPHVIYNATTGSYVLWINVYDNQVGYRVFTSRNPAGPFKEVAEPRLAVNADMPVAGLNNGDHDTFVDEDGTAYLAYTDWRAKGAIVIEQLSADYLTGTGKFVHSVTAGNTEAPCLFKRKGIYYVVYSDPNCGYCSGTGSSYKTAASPLGPWSEGIKISDHSCGGQPSFVSVIKVNAETIFLYGSDLWNNAAKNEALANYYWAPLSFTGTGAIQPLACGDNYRFSKAGKPLRATAPADGYSIQGDITKERQYAQSFTIQRSGQLHQLSITMFKNQYPDAELVVELYAAGPDSLPIGKPIFQKNIHPANLGWSPRNLVVQPDLTVDKGAQYVMVLKTAATRGHYGYVYNTAGMRAGKLATHTGQQEGFTVLPGRSIKYTTLIVNEK
ncbi:MAG: family 43 glycosylhydrolase [Candidatus Pseudobacter hemicellulosilyticus]|uniref:Family 43 glycosylhydrolase n=1 Tax=Candidatus Pseudobacter hemicellulosilyticus TaxID=3121375 RepID=A0AAJ6BH82_9BACT|nr:MAG: family 43 glycosylhydrolase [Pseudobacter sp.]